MTRFLHTASWLVALLVLAPASLAQSSECSAPSAGLAPADCADPATPPFVSPLAPGDDIFTHNESLDQFETHPQNDPTTATVVAPYVAPSFFNAMDFQGNDLTTLYGVATNGEAVAIDAATGSVTSLGTILAPNSGTWTGLTWDFVDNVFYGISGQSCGGPNFTLSIVDFGALTATPVGDPSLTCPVTLASDPFTGTLYAVDVIDDNLHSIDSGTAASAVIGPVGFDANFGQAMDFDNEDGTLYYHTAGSFNEFRSVDTATGATTTIGPAGGQIAASASETMAAVGPGGVSIDVIGFTDDPQRDDFVFIRARATNSSASTVRTRVYFTVDYPDGTDRTYSVLSSNFPGNSSFQVQKIKRMKFPLAASAPAGTYTVTVFAADDIANGGTIYDSDTFSFTLPAPFAKAGTLASGVDAGPNPFRTETTIRYTLAEDAEVDLRVFDVTGREVATLASGVQSAGAQSALFSAGDLPGGVYVWRLAAGGEVTTGRVTLAR